MRLRLLFVTSALADRSPWPRSPLDAERGPDGVMLVKNSAMLGDVQWDLDGSCAHTGAKGYRVVVADSPYRSDDAMLVLPPFPVPPQGAVKLTFWARVLVPFGTRAPSEPPRVKVVFLATNTPPWASIKPAASWIDEQQAAAAGGRGGGAGVDGEVHRQWWLAGSVRDSSRLPVGVHGTLFEVPGVLFLKRKEEEVVE